MAGVFRTGYQAIADAIWSLVAVGSRTVTVTTNFGNDGIRFSAGSRTSATVSASSRTTCDFGSRDLSAGPFNARRSGGRRSQEIDLTFVAEQVMDTRQAAVGRISRGHQRDDAPAVPVGHIGRWECGRPSGLATLLQRAPRRARVRC
jgi:hypothetical protein